MISTFSSYFCPIESDMICSLALTGASTVVIPRSKRGRSQWHQLKLSLLAKRSGTSRKRGAVEGCGLAQLCSLVV